MLIGLPLLVFGFIAREIISRFNEERGDLRTADIRDVEAFWQRVNEDVNTFAESEYAAPETEIGARIWWAARPDTQLTNGENLPAIDRNQVKQALTQDASSTLMRHLHESNSLSAQATEISDRLWFPERWLHLLAHLIGGNDDDSVCEIVRLRNQARSLEDSLYEAVTKGVLAKHDFYRLIESPAELESHAINATKNAVTLAWEQTEKSENQAVGVTKNAVTLTRDQSAASGIQADAATKPNKADVAERRKRIRDRLVKAQSLNIVIDGLTASLGNKELTATARKAFRDRLDEVDKEISSNNVGLLKLHYHDCMRDESIVYAGVVAYHDQIHRLWILGIALAVFLFSAWVVDMNATSLHSFYRNQLAATWIDPAYDSKHKVPLRRLEGTKIGAPYHLISATLNRFIGGYKHGTSPLAGFLFSRNFCGSDATSHQSTDKYMDGTYDLANAVALSGAAVNPMQFRNPLVLVLSLLFNFRLGQWLPNPAFPGTPIRVTPLRLLADIIIHRSTDRRYCLITDGGHYENLGLEPLLMRRCKFVIVSDATCDPGYSFDDFVAILRRMRVEHGIRFRELGGDHDLPLSTICPEGERKLSQSHFLVGRIDYPELDYEEDGYLIYIKPTFTGDENLESNSYRRSNAAFPNDPTADQAFSAEKFEAYRQLGFHIGESLARQAHLIREAIPEDLVDWRPVTDAETIPLESGKVLFDRLLGRGESNDIWNGDQLSAVETAADIKKTLPWLASLSPDYREIARKLLSNADPTQENVKQFLDALDRKVNTHIREGVVRVLGNLDLSHESSKKQLAAVQKKLRELLADSVPSVRKYAARSLERIRRSGGKGTTKRGPRQGGTRRAKR